MLDTDQELLFLKWFSNGRIFVSFFSKHAFSSGLSKFPGNEVSFEVFLFSFYLLQKLFRPKWFRKMLYWFNQHISRPVSVKKMIFSLSCDFKRLNLYTGKSSSSPTGTQFLIIWRETVHHSEQRPELWIVIDLILRNPWGFAD